MRLFGLTLGAMAVLMGTTITSAQDARAVIIANENYDIQRDIRDSRNAVMLDEHLTDFGFDVSSHVDRSANDLRSGMERIRNTISDADTLLVVVAGHVAGDDRDSWLLATDAPVVNGLNVGLSGISLVSLSDAMAGVDGEAVLLVGMPDEATRISADLRKFVASDALADEVTVFTGPIDDLIEWARDELLQPGRTYAQAIRNAPRSVRAFGDLPLSAGLVPEGAGNLPDELETLLFERAELLNSETALEDYLDRYPQGYYAQRAKTLLADLRRSPAETAQDAETALNLSRTDRRDIQANLTLLGYDTNGVDGLFGQGTRRAIRQWQKANSRSDTGFLNRVEISLIKEQADAERQRIEREDSELWSDTRERGDRPAFEAYLAKYPQGLFADVARSELRKLEDRDWNDANATNTGAAFRAFLNSWPNGVHATEALEKLRASENAVDLSRVQREETELLSNPLTRLLAEGRLNDLGFRPGIVDGTFDDSTRSAIKRFQEDRGLTPHGYVDRQTAAQLLTN